MTMSSFEFNVALKDSLFDLTPPADYKLQSLDVDASEAREQDLVTAVNLARRADLLAKDLLERLP